MLDKKKKYLQIALNGSLLEARNIINRIPLDDRLIIEAGTPLIKKYGVDGIKSIRRFWEQRMLGNAFQPKKNIGFIKLFRLIKEAKSPNSFKKESKFHEPYIVADLKCMDRGFTEVILAKESGAKAATALGHAPIETINAFIEKCEEIGLDSMIDMMNVDYPIKVLSQLKNLPNVVILHRGVDEEDFNPEKEIPYHEIQRIKSNYDIMIAVAGGDNIQEVQRAIFNDVDIVVVWRSFHTSSTETTDLAQSFLKEIR